MKISAENFFYTIQGRWTDVDIRKEPKRLREEKGLSGSLWQRPWKDGHTDAVPGHNGPAGVIQKHRQHEKVSYPRVLTTSAT